MKRSKDTIDWFESEEPTRLALTAEVQRIGRRVRVRPWPVILVTLALTALVVWRFGLKPRLYTADVVLVLHEGALANPDDSTIPFDQLKDYVSHVLLPDVEVEKIIEKRAPGRIARVGAPFALSTFYDRVEILIWKNSFAYYDEEDANAQKSARIGIEVSDEDPDVALDVARDLSRIAIATHDAQRRTLTTELADTVTSMRDAVNQELAEASSRRAEKQAAVDDAKAAGNNGRASALLVEVATLDQQIKRLSDRMKAIEISPDTLAEQVTEAGLGTRISMADQFKPEKVEQSWILIAMLAAVVGTMTMIGASLVFGSFDARVHDTEDVARLGLPVLGHVPSFPGDNVGSLQARGVPRARVPLLSRWRSQR